MQSNETTTSAIGGGTRSGGRGDRQKSAEEKYIHNSSNPFKGTTHRFKTQYNNDY